MLGSHVGMSGKEMFLGSVKEALSYRSDTFMLYTGAPQNTRRRPVEEMRLLEGHLLMEQNGISGFIVHAPYIINLGNSVKTETYELAVSFLREEIRRTQAMGSKLLVLHPGSHVDAGEEAGIAQIIKGLNEVLTADCEVRIALETMAGKGSELGKTFEELARITDGVVYNDKLCVCADTCHLHDAGYDIVNNPDGVLTAFDKILGLKRLAAWHINDSKNPLGAHKDRHENIGKGYIGFPALQRIVTMPEFSKIPKILETPYITDEAGNSVAPYASEIAMLRGEKTGGKE